MLQFFILHFAENKLVMVVVVVVGWCSSFVKTFVKTWKCRTKNE